MNKQNKIYDHSIGLQKTYYYLYDTCHILGAGQLRRLIMFMFTLVATLPIKYKHNTIVNPIIVFNNNMADKFEFKKQQTLEVPEFKACQKRRTSLAEYKQVILQLNQALNLMSGQNEALKLQMCELKQKNQTANKKYSQQLKKINQLEQIKRVCDQQMAKQTKINAQLKGALAKGNEREKYLITQIERLKQQIQQQQIERNKIHKSNQVNMDKIRILQNSLQSLFEHNKNMKIQMTQNNRYNEQQVQQLKQFSNKLKRKLQILEMDIPNHTQEIKKYNFFDDQEGFNQIKSKRSFSTQKKAKRNVGCLSTNIAKNSNKIGKFHQSYSRQNIRPFEIHTSLNNPEWVLGEQLQNIKKQIAQQFTLINLKQQSYSKQRVIKTLQALQSVKRKAGRAIQAVQESQNQSSVL